jgi:orotate phosphoribosyltransferase
MGMAALFTYAFPVADQAFKDAECPLFTLSDYPALIQYAQRSGLVQAETVALLNAWRENPSGWMQ